MKITGFPALGLQPDGAADTSAASGDIESRFSDYLQAFDASGKARIKADMEEKASGADAVSWILRLRAGDLYHDKRHDLMAERGLDHDDLDGMTEEERIGFETLVYARVRDELVSRMGRHHHCHCGDDELMLFGLGPFLMR